MISDVYFILFVQRKMLTVNGYKALKQLKLSIVEFVLLAQLHVHVLLNWHFDLWYLDRNCSCNNFAKTIKKSI